ncbi:hypothetical protein F5887DRAFT_1287977 [Amanita rubescens]|nr:hypothetical protein F5887DRAFT_1287977 [Amanita rubescens]
MSYGYQIQSIHTKQWLMSEPAGPEIRVTTKAKFIDIRPFFIVPEPHFSGTTTCIIKDGRNGSMCIRPGPLKEHIVWGKQPYEWQVAPKGRNDYEIYPAHEDLYWYQKTSTEPFVGLADRESLRGNNSGVFKLIAIDD